MASILSDIPEFSEPDMEQQPQQQQDTMSEAIRSKVDNLDIHTAIKELEAIIGKTAELHYKIKDLKFKSLSQTYEMFARVDLPSIMLNEGRKETEETYSSLKAVNKKL